MLRKLLAFMLAALLHAIGVGGVVHANLATELPEFWRPWCIYVEPPIHFHAGVLLQGSSETEVRSFLGQPSASPTDVRLDGRCLRFEYSGEEWAVTLLLEQGVVTDSWYGPDLPRRCRGRTEDLGTVPLQGKNNQG